MPKVSGLEACKTIKADEHLKIIPIVVFTSSRETPDLIEFYKHGVKQQMRNKQYSTRSGRV
jgi:CheY-like chemotaxis protein